MISTQISGSYRSTNRCLFTLRAWLYDNGIDVRHPRAAQFTGTVGGTMAAFDQDRFTFEQVERDFYASIATAPFHVLANCHDHDGYVGANAARETAYAMTRQKPVLVAHPVLQLSPDVAPSHARILDSNWSRVTVLNGPTPEIDVARLDAVQPPQAYRMRGRGRASGGG